MVSSLGVRRTGRFSCARPFGVSHEAKYLCPGAAQTYTVPHFPLLPSKPSSEPLQGPVEIPSPMCFQLHPSLPTQGLPGHVVRVIPSWRDTPPASPGGHVKSFLLAVGLTSKRKRRISRLRFCSVGGAWWRVSHRGTDLYLRLCARALRPRQ